MQKYGGTNPRNKGDFIMNLQATRMLIVVALILIVAITCLNRDPWQRRQNMTKTIEEEALKDIEEIVIDQLTGKANCAYSIGRIIAVMKVYKIKKGER